MFLSVFLCLLLNICQTWWDVVADVWTVAAACRSFDQPSGDQQPWPVTATCCQQVNLTSPKKLWQLIDVPIVSHHMKTPPALAFLVWMGLNVTLWKWRVLCMKQVSGLISTADSKTNTGRPHIYPKHLRKYDRLGKMFVLPLFIALNCNGCFCQNIGWSLVNGWKLSACNCCFVFRVWS